MRRILSFLLIVILLFSLSACNPGNSNPVQFYYCRDSEDYRFFEENGVIQWENRDIVGHDHDLRYVLGLYLAGPLEEGLKSPFPKTVRLLSFSESDTTLTIELSDLQRNLTDPEFSLACACLTLTFLNYTQCSDIIITSGERSITMNKDSILLFDALQQLENAGG